MLAKSNIKRSFINKNDPFYKSPKYEKTHNSIFATGMHLNIIKPKNHVEMLNLKTKAKLADQRSKILRKYCSLEKTMYNTK